MARKLTFWFEFASTYSYLSAMRIDDLAEAAGVDISWRPVPLGPIFSAQGWTTSPFTIYPAKGRYMWRDMDRLCAARGLPFLKPDTFPQNSIHGARVALAALETDRGPAFCKAVYTAQFAHGQNIADVKTLAAALASVGLPTGMVEAARDPVRKEELKACSADAAKLGLFGAPSFTVGGEVFWGDDRLEDALDWARAGDRTGTRTA